MITDTSIFSSLLSFRVLSYTLRSTLTEASRSLWGTHRSRRELLTEELLEGVAVLGELLDALVQLVERHLLLEQLPAELGLVVDVGDLGVLLGRGAGGLGVELLGDGRGVVLELLEEKSIILKLIRLDDNDARGEVDAGESFDLADVAEGGAHTHDDGLVPVLLVVVEDLLHRLHTRVLIADVVLARLVLLVPVKDL